MKKILTLLCFSVAFCRADIQFENATGPAECAARDVIRSVSMRFENLSGRPAPDLDGTIQFYSGKSLSSLWVPEGISVLGRFRAGASGFVIQIAAGGAWQRILAHEITHALLHETFSDLRNRALSEGISEYISAALFPCEVRDDMRRAELYRDCLACYLDGYEFCRAYAANPLFAAFVAWAAARRANSFTELEDAWSEFCTNPTT